MALMQLTVIPLGTGTTSVGAYIARIQEALDKEGVCHQLTDMGTTVEGDVSSLLALAAKIHALPFQQGVQRVVTHIMIDDRRDRQISIGDKVVSVGTYRKKLTR
jgi:uncharacterized protein (TIGR00106 family)